MLTDLQLDAVPDPSMFMSNRRIPKLGIKYKWPYRLFIGFGLFITTMDCMFVFPQNVYVETLTHSGMLLGIWAFGG